MIEGLPRWPLVVALLFSAASAHSQTSDLLPPETRLVGLSTAPAASSEDFTIAASQDLVVTLTDLQVPAALSTATVVVTQGGTMVGNATLAAPATTALLSILGAVGQYTLRVFGAPNASYSVGTFTVCVAPKGNASACIEKSVDALVSFLPLTAVSGDRLNLQPFRFQIDKAPLINQLRELIQDLVNDFHYSVGNLSFRDRQG